MCAHCFCASPCWLTGGRVSWRRGWLCLTFVPCDPPSVLLLHMNTHVLWEGHCITDLATHKLDILRNGAHSARTTPPTYQIGQVSSQLLAWHCLLGFFFPYPGGGETQGNIPLSYRIQQSLTFSCLPQPYAQWVVIESSLKYLQSSQKDSLLPARGCLEMKSPSTDSPPLAL